MTLITHSDLELGMAERRALGVLLVQESIGAFARFWFVEMKVIRFALECSFFFSGALLLVGSVSWLFVAAVLWSEPCIRLDHTG